MMIRCSGCGGSNPQSALVCEWCRRPFVQTGQRGLSARWWGALSGAIVAFLLIMIGVLLFLNANRSYSRAAAAPTPSALPLPPFSIASPVAAGSPVGLASPTLFNPPPIAGAPVSTPDQATTVKLVRVTNTGGQGLNLRREPATSAVAVASVAENSTLRLVGAEQRAEGRLWKQVDDGRGNEGWVPGEYLVEVNNG
jgi:hypothetical protein